MKPRVCLILLAPLICLAALGQEPVNVPNGAPLTLSVDVDMVLLNVSVLDDRGRPVSGLRQENFQLYEDAAPQQIRSFRAEDVPATVGLVIDNSGSMVSKRSEVISAALEFAMASNPGDEMFIVHFNDVVRLPQFDGKPFTSRYSDMEGALNQTNAIGRTALYDALLAGLETLERGSHSKKALVVLSDGGDNASASKLDDVVRLAKKSTATLYTIGFYDRSTTDRNWKALHRLATLTGGDAYVATTFAQLRNVWLKIAGGIRSQYTVGYISTNPRRDGSFRSINVVVKDRRKNSLHVMTRSGYLAPVSADTER